MQSLFNIGHTVIILEFITFDRMISGAKYSGVPHNVHVRPFTRFANPKSVICYKMGKPTHMLIRVVLLALQRIYAGL